MAKRSRNTSKKIVLICAVLIAGGVVTYWLWPKPNDKKMVAGTSVSNNSIRGTPSTPTQPQLPTNSSSTPGGVTDQQGKTSGTLPPSSDWVSSSSGTITVQQPSSGSTVQSGDTLSGLAKVSTVQFILTDSSVGMIDQGNLSVVNGKFSGALEFTPHASSGKLEVYYPNPTNGAEEDIVDINVNFNG